MSDRLASVLAHPLRRRLLLEYHREATSPSRAARRLGASVSLVSYHTDVLARHDCIELVRTARRRGAVEHFYRATASRFIEDDEWPRVPSQLRRGLVLGTLTMAADEARRAALEGAFDDTLAHISRSLLVLDDEGVRAVARTLRGTIGELERIEAACRERAGPARRTHEVVMLEFATLDG